MSVDHPDDCPCIFCAHNVSERCHCPPCEYIYRTFGDLRVEHNDKP